MKENEITICGDIAWDTPKAVKFTDGVSSCWLPRRMIKIRQLSNGHEFTMPEKLAREKGLLE